MPPATNTGMSSLTLGRISCASTDVDTGPIWPPASMPSITSASTFERISFLASASAGAKAISLAPRPLILSIAHPGGRPPASTTWPTSCLAQTSIRSLSCGCIVMRLTPNGRDVRALVSAISVSSSSGVIAPQAITPKPPAFEMAETRFRSETQLIAPPMIATSQPRNSVPRCISSFRRAWPIEAWTARGSAIRPSPLTRPAPRRGRKRCAEPARRVRYIPRARAPRL